LKLNGVWMIIKCARWNVGLKLNWARSYLDDNRTCPTECLVEIEWVWMVSKCARWNIGLKLNWARSYLDDKKNVPD